VLCGLSGADSRDSSDYEIRAVRLAVHNMPIESALSSIG